MERLAIAEDERVLRETTAGGASMDLAYANARVPSLANVKSHAEDLDDYLERLYDDDMNARVDATARIAALARRVENLPMLLGHDTLVQTLARVLREEGRKSVDLATNVVSVFFAFSNYSQFHPAILENQMGDATMRIVGPGILWKAASIQLGFMLLGLLFGRPILRGLARFILPPRHRGLVAPLWTIDGKSPTRD